MSRHLLCTKCADKYLPEGKRQIYSRSKFNEPAEYQRLVLGIAKTPMEEQRVIYINNEPSKLPVAYFNCDFCNAEILPGHKCAALTIWTENTIEPIETWESEFIFTVKDGVNRLVN